MRYLSTALYAEGSTDVHFLKPLLQRVCGHCTADSVEPVETSDVLDLGSDRPAVRHLPRDQRILEAAREAKGAWVVLFIHADADGDSRGAVRERVEPARALLTAEWGAGGTAVAVVPVRTTEAWALADSEALRRAFGTTLTDAELGLSDAMAHGADRLSDPKATLTKAFNAARGRRRSSSVSPYMGLIGETVSLDRLRTLAAYRSMEAELRLALKALGIM